MDDGFDLHLPQILPFSDLSKELEEAKSLLQPFEELFRNSFDNAVKHFNRMPEEFRSPLDAQTKANIIRCYVVNDVRTWVGGVERVELAERGLFLAVVIGGRLALRMKKMDAGGAVSVNQTDQGRRFDGQGSLEYLGIPTSALHLNIGFVLDLEDRLVATLVSRPQLTGDNGVQIQWAYHFGPVGAMKEASADPQSQTPRARATWSVAPEGGTSDAE